MNKLTYRDRFAEALGALTLNTCPDNLIDEWLNGESDELQSWAVSNQIFDWAMGITIVEACQLLAEQPEEGRQHDIDYNRPEYQRLVEENNILHAEIEYWRQMYLDVCEGDD